MTDTTPEPRVLLMYAFRFRDPLTGKRVRARYVAKRIASPYRAGAVPSG